MNKPQVTPGPWTVLHLKDGSVRVESINPDYVNHGKAVAFDLPGPDAEANAKAIAALPVMVAALQRAIELAEPLTGQGEDAIWRPANEIWETSVAALRQAGILPPIDGEQR